jgi:hypothetical protein
MKKSFCVLIRFLIDHEKIQVYIRIISYCELLINYLQTNNTTNYKTYIMLFRFLVKLK